MGALLSGVTVAIPRPDPMAYPHTSQVREQGGRAGRRARVCVRVRMKCVVHTLCLVTGGRRGRVHVAYGSSSSSWQLFNFTIDQTPAMRNLACLR